MTINRSTLLDLPLPVTGTEDGTWGDVTNNGLTQYLDIAIAGMVSLTSSDFTAGDLTIALTEGDSSATNIANTSAQYSAIKVSSLAQNSTITAPGSNRAYKVINSDSTYTLTIKASGQTGVTFAPGTTGIVAFNGTDYEILGVVGPASATDNAVPKFDGTTGQIIQGSGVTIDDSNNVSGVAQLNATTADLTNIEVTNIKAKDGTSAGSIADSTGVVTLASSVLTTTDINGGSIDAVTLGTNSAVTEAQIDNININGNAIISTNTDGNLSLTPNGAGNLVLDGLNWPQADGTADYVLKTDGAGQLSWTAQTGGGGGGGGTSVTVTQATATASQTTFSVTYTVGQLSVYLNGALLASADYTASNGTSVVLASGAASGDIFTAVAYSTVTTVSQGDTAIEVTDTGSDGTITFDTDGSERMRITNTGDVIIGGTTELDANGGLTIAKTNNYPDFNLFRDDGSIGSAQPLGRIKWWAKDTTSNIPLVHAYIEATGSGIHAAGDNPTDLVFATTPDGTETVAEAGRITQSGAYVLKGGTTAPGGVGITFPATQSASTNANTLDDYEEGTFTPSYSATGATFTYQYQNGRYRKIGSQVFVEIFLRTSAVSGGSGNVSITGLPFGVSLLVNSQQIVGGPVIYANNFTGDAPTSLGIASNNSTNMLMWYRTASNTDLDFVVQASDLGTGANGNWLSAQLSYVTND